MFAQISPSDLDLLALGYTGGLCVVALIHNIITERRRRRRDAEAEAKLQALEGSSDSVAKMPQSRFILKA